MDIKFNPFPVLSTKRTYLRRLVMSDDKDLFLLRSIDSVNKFLLRKKYESIEDARKFILNIDKGIDANENILWAIVLEETDEFIGTICIWNILTAHYRAEIGFEIHPDFSRKGLMSEILPPVLQFGFEKMGLHSFAAVVSPDNAASIRLLEKNNFRREAFFKEDVFHNGKFIDTAVYSLLNKN